MIPLRVLPPLFLALATWAAVAQDQSDFVDETSAAQNAVRREGTGPQVSDHIAFYALVNHIKQRHTRNQAFALDRVQHDLALESRSEAATILERLLEASDAIELESQQLTNELLCDVRVSINEEQAYQRLDALDDLRELTMQRRYLLLLSSLDTKTSEKLQSHVQRFKEGVYYLASDHKAAYEAGGGDVLVVVSQICGK
jgi:anion-transporting  ArsA/GET3 family ATPase